MTSNLKVNNILPSTGDTVAVSGIASVTSSVSIASSCTATTFYGSGANLTSLPAANLTGTLPAISGANLTSLPSQVTINGAGSNRLITSDSGTTLNCESSLTYDGTTLQAITALSGTREQLNLKNQNASAGTSRINFFSTVSGTEFACAAIRNGVNTLNQGRLFLQTNKGSGLTNSLELDQSGNATITDGNLVIGTAGHGIDFSAAAHAGGMSSELLDDYEEGTFTPTSSQVTLTGTIAGHYTKIGDLCYVSCIFMVPSTSNTSDIEINGLPFNAKNGTDGNYIQGGFVTYHNQGGGPYTVLLANNDNRLIVYQANGQRQTFNNFSNKHLRLAAIYKVA